MFGKNKNNSNVSHDIDVMMQMMDKVIQGEYDEIDVTAFDNPAYGEKLNELIHAFKKSNNNFVMRLNEAMESIGDNSYVKNTLDQVQSQTDSIAEMEEASHNLEESINNISKTVGGIQDNTHEMLAVAQNSTANMNESIKVVNQSSENISRINEQVQEFQDKIDKISEIVDIVKKVASQSNLLALNASIEAARAGEAGKGFAVVADEIRNLAEQSASTVANIQEITDKVRAAVARLVKDTESLLAFVGNDVSDSFDGFEKLADSYNEDANYVEGLVTDFSAASQQLLASVTGVTASIGEVTRAAGDGAANTETIADRIGDINAEAAKMQEIMKGAQEAAAQLRADTKKFTVA